MRRTILLLPALLALLLPAMASASAPMRTRLLCNSFYAVNEPVNSEDDVVTLAIPKQKPRSCAIWRDGWAHYQ